MAEPSVSAGIWESLFNTYLLIAIIVGGLVIGWLFYSLWRFREAPGDERPFDAPVAGVLPAERGRAIWSWAIAAGIAAIMFGLAFSTISATDAIEKPPQGREWLHYNVTGFQFGWKYNYTGAGGIPFQKIGDWTVPANSVVVMNITSQDVWHNFAIADYRIRVDAIPGEVNTLWFEATQTGTFGNVCVQICGSSHAVMKSTMNVVSPEEYRTWLAEQSQGEYNRLETRIYRDAKQGTVLNVTLGDAAGGAERVVPGKPVILNLTNAGASAVTATAGGNSVTVPPGGSARLYALAPASGALTLTTSNGQTANYPVVSS